MPLSVNPLELLKEVRKLKTQKEVAELLSVDTKTVSRWKNEHIEPAPIVGLTLKDFIKPELPK